VTAPDPGFAQASFGQRANLVGSPSINNKSVNAWFNSSAFARPAFGTYGNLGRNTLTQPGINNWDVGLAKTFRFTERVGFQFRMETFNTFNHTQYGIDPTAAASGGPGQSAVDGNLADSGPGTNNNFGKILSARPGRILQLGAKVTF
jgi:hypothetical protein